MDSDSRRSGRLAQPISSSSMAPDDYMVQRVDDQLAWLGKKSQRNKSAFLFHRVVGIGLGALITILSPYAGQPGAWKTWIPPLLQISGAGVAIAGSLLPQWVGRATPHEDIHHALHHRAAAETHHLGEHQRRL